MAIRPEDRMPKRSEGKMEKYIVRKAFEDKNDPFLPNSILWRQKEQFSDGVGYNWIDQIVAYCNNIITDSDFARAAERFLITRLLQKRLSISELYLRSIIRK